MEKSQVIALVNHFLLPHQHRLKISKQSESVDIMIGISTALFNLNHGDDPDWENRKHRMPNSKQFWKHALKCFMKYM